MLNNIHILLITLLIFILLIYIVYKNYKSLYNLLNFSSKSHEKLSNLIKYQSKHAKNYEAFQNENLFHAITVSTKAHIRLDNLIRSAKNHGFNYTILGLEENTIFSNQNEAFTYKLNKLKEYVNNLDPNDIVLSTDAWDVVLVNGNPKLLYERYIKFNKPIVFSAEKNLILQVTNKRNEFDLNTPFPYLNGGGLIGKAGVIKELIDTHLLNNNGKYIDGNDQVVWTYIYLENKDLIALDTKAEIFLSLYMTNPNNYDFTNNIFTYKETNTQPLIIHGNGHQYEFLDYIDGSIQYIPEFYTETNTKINIHNVEIIEQIQADTFITPNLTVLELGARYGTVSYIINNKLADKSKQVSVEPDSAVWNILEENMKRNNVNVNILKGVISNKPIKLVGEGYSLMAENVEKSDIPMYTLEEVEKKYNLKFDTLVADCEGCLESFFNENDKMYTQLQLIIMEEDQVDKCNYDIIKENLIKYGFKLINNHLDGIWRSVWKKNINNI